MDFKKSDKPEGYEESDEWMKPLDEEYVSRWSQPNKSASRWGPSIADSEQNNIEKSFTAQCFSYLPLHEKSVNEIEVLIRKHRIDDLTKRLILQDFEQQNDADLRSPSPPPLYDQKSGLRTNTRELRYKDKYQKERYRLISDVIRMDPTYVPPSDYKPPKKSMKIFIPTDESINYIG